MELREVNCAENPQQAAQQTVLTIPTLIVYLDGREGLRKAHSLSLSGLEQQLSRAYEILTHE